MKNEEERAKFLKLSSQAPNGVCASQYAEAAGSFAIAAAIERLARQLAPRVDRERVYEDM